MTMRLTDCDTSLVPPTSETRTVSKNQCWEMAEHSSQAPSRPGTETDMKEMRFFPDASAVTGAMEQTLT